MGRARDPSVGLRRGCKYLRSNKSVQWAEAGCPPAHLASYCAIAQCPVSMVPIWVSVKNTHSLLSQKCKTFLIKMLLPYYIFPFRKKVRRGCRLRIEGFNQRSWTSLLEIKVSKFIIILCLQHLNFTNTDTQQTCVSRQILKIDTGVAVAISSKTVDFSLSAYTLCSSYHARTHIWSSQWQHVWNGGAFRAGVGSLCSRNTEGGS